MSTNSPAIIDITLENAQQWLIEESFNRLVVADFWAAWCAPCKQLMPVLERLANEFGGRFLLAKVNADELPMITQQLSVRSLPTIMFFKDGQPIDGFTGAQPESAIRKMLETHLPNSWDSQLPEAVALIEAGDLVAATALLRTLWQESQQQSNIGFYLAHCYIQQQRKEDAEAILHAIPEQDRDGLYQELSEQLAQLSNKTQSPALAALLDKLAQDADNLALKFEAATALLAEQYTEEALEQLIQIMRKDKHFNDGAARKMMLDIFARIGNKDPLAVKYQRQLFSLLY